MNTVPRILPIIFILCATLEGPAGQTFGAENRLEAISAFITDDTIVAAHVDLARIDVGAALHQVADLAGLRDEERAQLMGAQLVMIEGAIAALKRAGASDIYAAASLQDFMRSGPSILVPVNKGGDARAVAAVMFSGNPQGPTSREEANERKYSGPRMFPTCEIVGEVVLCGDKETLERLKNSKAAARPEFADALAAASDTAAQVIFAPTADQRRVLAEMLPQLPEDLGGGSGKAPANGLIWAVVGLQTQPKLSARLIIQSKDAESAAQFERFIAAAGRTADRMLDKKDKPAEFAKLVELFTPKAQGSRLTLELSEENQALVKVKSLLATVAVGARKPAQRSQCANNLKQLALAMYNFHDAYGSFPPSASYDGKSKKLLSWRVHLLPFVEAQALYEQFHLDEPWDSEHNKKLIPKMPPVFACPSAKTREKGMTTYLAPLGEKTIFSGKAGVALKEITDGTSNTIMLVDVAPDRAVIWTKPDDLEVDFDNPLKGLETHHDGGFQSAFCDGAVRFISPSIGPEKLRLLLMRNDGKPVGAF